MTTLPSIAVGLVGPLPPPSGGMANQTRQLARLLTESGLRVEVVQTNPPYSPAWVERLRGVRALTRLAPYIVRLWRCAGRVDVLHVMANSGWAWHLFAAPAIWIARLRRRPAVVNYRGGEAESFLARQSGWMLPSLARAALLIVPSGFLQSVFAKYGVSADIVPNVVDLGRFQPGVPLAGAPHLIVTRNLEAIYGIPTALRAFARVLEIHPDARLSVAGSGPDRGDLERLSAQLGIDAAVTFTGRLDSDAMGGLYRSAHVVLNPSLVDNTPNSILEAMASGVPVVSTNVGGIPYLVEDGRTALLVPPGDDAAMAGAVLKVLADRALARNLADAGLRAVQSFTWPRVRPVLFDAYARAIGRASNGAASRGVAGDRARRGG